MANITDAFDVEKLSVNNGVLITSGTLDPSTTGYEAPVGSLYINTTTGSVYHKNASADTAWNTFGNVDTLLTFNNITGFVNRADSTMTFNNGTRQFTIAPLSPATSFEFLINGITHTISTTKTLTLPNTTDTYYIYFDETDTLQYSTAMSDALFEDYPLMATIYYNTGIPAALFFNDERHGISMDGTTHEYLHEIIGTRYLSGFDPGGTWNTSTTSPTDADVQISFTGGILRDEDIRHSIVNTGGKINSYDLEQTLSSIAQIPVFYRFGSAGDWYAKTADNYPVIYSGTAGYTGANGRLPYNQWTGTTWQLTQLASNTNHVLVHIFGSNNTLSPVFAVQGSTDYPALPTDTQARLELQSLGTLPVREMVPLVTLIFQSHASYTNTIKARGRQTALATNYFDWRSITNFAATAVKTVTAYIPPWYIISAAYTANNGDNIIADTNAGAFTITLPATPTIGNTIRIKDSRGTFATNNLTIGRNGNNIIAAAADLVVDINYADLTLVYQDATVGWTI